MSLRHISRQECPGCKQVTIHIAKKCNECGHAQEFASELRLAGLKKLRFYRPRGSGMSTLNPRIAKAFADVLKTKTEQRVASGELELSAMPKRPRSINSERRPIKRDEE